MKNRMYTTFTVGWLADFPDPHNWFQPFMHPSGTYCGRQNVTYGLDPTSLAANWYEGATYPPPPYTNALGEYVSAINNSYVAHMIDVGVGEDLETRHMIYEELMDIYHAEATQLPLDVAIGRHYERTWIHGYDKTFNMNPIAPGPLFYTIWKAIAVEPVNVDVSAFNVEIGSNNITSYLISQSYHAPRAGIPWMKLNYTSKATVPIVPVTAYVQYYNTTGPDVIVYLIWAGKTPKGHMEQFGYAYGLIYAGTSISLGPEDVSKLFPAVGDYELWVLCFVLSEFAFNINVTKNFDASWFNATGFCDINGDLVVDGQDFQLVKRAVPSMPGGTKWRWAAEVSSDGVIDGTDYQLVKITIPKVYTKS
jgi:hypothetical protein